MLTRDKPIVERAAPERERRFPNKGGDRYLEVEAIDRTFLALDAIEALLPFVDGGLPDAKLREVGDERARAVLLGRGIVGDGWAAARGKSEALERVREYLAARERRSEHGDLLASAYDGSQLRLSDLLEVVAMVNPRR